jgi:hypothetical protein
LDGAVSKSRQIQNHYDVPETAIRNMEEWIRKDGGSYKAIFWMGDDKTWSFSSPNLGLLRKVYQRLKLYHASFELNKRTDISLSLRKSWMIAKRDFWFERYAQEEPGPLEKQITIMRRDVDAPYIWADNEIESWMKKRHPKDGNLDAWLKSYMKIIALFKSKKRLPKQGQSEEEKSMYHWLTHHREFYRKHTLIIPKFLLLRAIGFDLDPKGKSKMV